MKETNHSAKAISRRSMLKGAAVAAGGLVVAGRSWAQGQAPAVVPADRMRPAVPYGVQSGDVTGDRAIVWSKTDRPARLLVEYATNDAFRSARRITGPAAFAETDFTARVDLSGLPSGQDIFYRVTFQDLADTRVLSAPASGRFRTPSSAGRTITFAWSGDEAGQGWGINPGWGGMKMYEVMRQAKPDFFIHRSEEHTSELQSLRH